MWIVRIGLVIELAGVNLISSTGGEFPVGQEATLCPVTPVTCCSLMILNENPIRVRFMVIR